MIGPLFFSLVVLMSGAGIAWFISRVRQDVSVVEPYYALGHIVVAWISFMRSPPSTRHWLLAILVTIWGLRLAVQLLVRGQGEGPRWTGLRKQEGDLFDFTSLYRVFVPAAGVVWFVSMPIQIAEVTDPHPIVELYTLDYLGVVMFTFGFLLEAASDAHLFLWQRKTSNIGRVLDRGLWGYSRHPNYFGEALVWIGLYLIAAASGWAAVAVWSPVIVVYGLLKVTGIPPVEAALRKKKPGYELYCERTSAFFPKRPKAAGPEELALDPVELASPATSAIPKVKAPVHPLGGSLHARPREAPKALQSIRPISIPPEAPDEDLTREIDFPKRR